MESRISIDIDIDREERLLVNFAHSEDVRDKLLAMFLQHALPFESGKNQPIFDGYCRICFLERPTERSMMAEIRPIHPIDMLKHIPFIEETASKFEKQPVK